MILKGVRCPYCGGPISAFETPRSDFHAPEGWSWARYMIPVRSPQPLHPSDRRTSRVVQTGDHRGEAVAEYEHVLAGYCSRCSTGFCEQQMERGDPDRASALQTAPPGAVPTGPASAQEAAWIDAPAPGRADDKN